MAKLLLVEDDNNLREIYEARLQAEGYVIVSAKDGEEALVVAKAEKPDLIISDVMMPKISGFEMLDILRNTEELKGVKVIMLSALGQSDDQQRADKLGADRYLVKSQVTLEDIVKTTHELLGDQNAQADASVISPAADTPATTPVPAPEPAAAPQPQPQPAPSPEPVQTPTPAPTPPPSAPELKTEPAPEPPKPDASKPADQAGKTAEPTNKEEAEVEAKIEDFVAGASSEPTAPIPAPEPEPVKPEPVATVTATSPNPSTSDDQLMSNAVETLVASTEDGKDKNAGGQKTTTIPVSIAPATDQAPQAAPTSDSPAPEPAKPAQPAGKDGSDDSDRTDDGPLVHEKVIQPPDSKPGKDIKQLLAEEEAREAQSVPGATISGATPVEEDRPAGAPMASPSESAAAADNPSEPDPGSIAL